MQAIEWPKISWIEVAIEQATTRWVEGTENSKTPESRGIMAPKRKKMSARSPKMVYSPLAWGRGRISTVVKKAKRLNKPKSCCEVTSWPSVILPALGGAERYLASTEPAAGANKAIVKKEV
jgi:hypothetical protein